MVRRQERSLGKMRAGQKGCDEGELKQNREPSQKIGRREFRQCDVARRSVDIHQLETRRHNQDQGEDQAPREDGRSSLSRVTESHWTMLRDRWDRSHLYRAATSVSALILVAVAVPM